MIVARHIFTVNMTVNGHNYIAGDIEEFDDMASYSDFMLLVNPPDLEFIEIQKRIAKKKEKIALGLLLIENLNGWMDYKRFDDDTKANRRSAKTILKPIYAELVDGNLRDAIDEIKAVTDFSSVYIKKPILLKMRNEIETYLGLPLSNSWND